MELFQKRRLSVHYDTYIKDINVGLNDVISKFAGDSKIDSLVLSNEDKVSKIYIQYQLGLIDRRCLEYILVPERWSKNYEIRLRKCMAWNKNVLGVKTASNRKFSQQCNDPARRVKRMLGFIILLMEISHLRLKKSSTVRYFSNIPLEVYMLSVLVSTPCEGHYYIRKRSTKGNKDDLILRWV